MNYLIDGYNLLFSHLELSKKSELIEYLSKKFKELKLKGVLVFDGKHLRGEESGLAYKSPLEIAYTPLDQSADAYIVELVEQAKNSKEIVVVTNDQGLTRHVRALRAHVQSNHAFLQFLHKKTISDDTKKQKESSYQIDRLDKIFTDRLDS